MKHDEHTYTYEYENPRESESGGREQKREKKIAANWQSFLKQKPCICGCLATIFPIFPGVQLCVCVCVSAPQLADGEKTVKFHTQTRLLRPRTHTGAQILRCPHVPRSSSASSLFIIAASCHSFLLRTTAAILLL